MITSYEEICQWFSKDWIEMPMYVIVDGFKGTTINFYGEAQVENFDLNSEDDDTVTVDGEEAVLRDKLVDIFLGSQKFNSDKDEFD